jgi:8-oxo-dGTP diphosphatase
MINDKPRPRVGVGVAVVKNNRILLGRRKSAHGAGAWSFPGGHLEFGENVEECARRELVEETGLNALSLRSGPWVNDIIDGDKHYITLFVFVNEFEGNLQLLEPDKCEGWKWFECHSLPAPLFPPVESLITKIGLEKLTWMGCKEKSLHVSF